MFECVNGYWLIRLQSVSWYIGLVQAGASLLTVMIYIMVLMRKRSKKNLKEQLRATGYES